MNTDPVTTQRFEDYVCYHRREHELLKSAQDAAKQAGDLRLEGLNHLRREVERDRQAFMPKAEADLINRNIEERLRKVENQSSSQKAVSVVWIIAVGIIFTIVQIGVAIFVK